MIGVVEGRERVDAAEGGLMSLLSAAIVGAEGRHWCLAARVDEAPEEEGEMLFVVFYVDCISTLPSPVSMFVPCHCKNFSLC